VVRLEVDDSRRLTGPNLLSDYPGAALEVYVEDINIPLFIGLWKKHLQQILTTLELQAEIYSRSFSGGANLGFSADEDMLYCACEINEAAVELARAEITGDTAAQTLTSIDNLRHLLAEERNPQLMALISAANAHNTTYLVDDDEFSLGMGNNCQIWPIDQLPDAENIQWNDYQDIPIALITGTNGKSTSVRMCDSIVKVSGVSAGITSTDYIRAGDTIIDKGDYSGPGGARTLIRDHRVEIALLEVARGGMLRRGLGAHTAQAALITNVADDHLGQYGINTVEELIAVKAVVARSLSANGTLVLNADDQGLIDYFENNPALIRGKLCWFSVSADHEKIVEQKCHQQACVWLEDEDIYIHDNGITNKLITVNDIPTTMNGAARHNISNSMGAAGLCYALGISLDDITSGLKNFRGDNKDNPGRGNYFDIKGAKVLIDFAHNPHSLTAIINTVAAMPAKRRLIMLGHAGDRTDRDIINLTDVASQLAPDVVVAAELADYLRGRELGVIPEMIRQHFVELGFKNEQIVYADSCLDGAKLAIEWAQPGDFILLLGLDQRDAIFNYLENL